LSPQRPKLTLAGALLSPLKPTQPRARLSAAKFLAPSGATAKLPKPSRPRARLSAKLLRARLRAPAEPLAAVAAESCLPRFVERRARSLESLLPFVVPLEGRTRSLELILRLNDNFWRTLGPRECRPRALWSKRLARSAVKSAGCLLARLPFSALSASPGAAILSAAFTASAFAPAAKLGPCSEVRSPAEIPASPLWAPAESRSLSALERLPFAAASLPFARFPFSALSAAPGAAILPAAFTAYPFAPASKLWPCPEVRSSAEIPASSLRPPAESRSLSTLERFALTAASLPFTRFPLRPLSAIFPLSKRPALSR
jgi:hypothetical protein